MPFSIVKSEDAKESGGTMFDNLFKGEGPKAAVTAIVLKSAPTEAVSKALTDMGFAVSEPQDYEGVTLLPQAQFAKGDTMLVKVNEDVAVMVPMMKMSGEFASVCAHRGFYPSINIATELLQEQLYKSVHKAKNGADAAEAISSVVADFGSYMAQLAKGLPADVFKLEKSEELASALAGDGSTAAPDTEDATAEEGAADADVEKADAEPTEAEIAEIEKGAGKAWKDMTDEEKKAAKAKAKGAAPMKSEDDVEKPATEGTDAPVAAAIDIAAIVKAVKDGISPEITALSEKIDSVSERVEKAESTAEQAAEQAKNTVFGGVFDSRADAVVEKNEGADRAPPLLDTGFRSVN